MQFGTLKKGEFGIDVAIKGAGRSMFKDAVIITFPERLATYCSKIDNLDQLMAFVDGDNHVKGLVSERHRKSVALIAAGQHFFSRFYSSASIRESILEKLWEEVDSPSVGDIGRWARSRIVAQAERVHMKLCHTEDMARSANYNGILMRVIRYRRKSRFKVFFRNLWRKVA